MTLPFLPGNSFNRDLGKGKFHKSHHFDNVNEVQMMVGQEKPGIGGQALLGQKVKIKNSVFPKGEGSNKPAWVAFDKQVLSFDAFFQEAVFEQRQEQYRVRNCKIYFYLEDDSIQVVEPRSKNAGLPQGTLIRRHRIPRPPPNDDEYFTVEDFNIGREIMLYGRKFKVTGCDEFTHNFLRKLGIKVCDPETKPADPYTKYRKALDESMQPLRPYEKFDTLKQFIDHDRHVLRFFCHWDDTDNMFGDSREMVLHYFLADDTIEIREVIQPNAGRDAAPMFLHRNKLPKDVAPLLQPGESTDRTVLNVFGPTGHGGRYILDSLKSGAVNTDCYRDNDMTIGAVINVLGRKLLLCDADDFTKEFYRTKYGINDFTPIGYTQSKGSAPSREMPPYNGFGSEEDSLCSCQGLIPKPPRRDFIKFMEKDRCGLESNVLRFQARLDTTKPIDVDRRFIVSYFLSDDTLLVFEPPVRNSGIGGGKFLERCRVRKPSQESYSTKLSQYYQASDLFVGARVDFNSHIFIMIDADEYAFRYMEQNSPEFSKASINSIMQRISQAISQPEAQQDLAAFLQRSDQSGSGCISFDQVSDILRRSLPGISDHEIMTIARHYSDRPGGDEAVDIGVLAYLVQDKLRKNNFDIKTNKLPEALMQIDALKSGYLFPERIITACKALQSFPIERDLLTSLLERCTRGEDGSVSYADFLRYLDWKDYPVVAPAHMDAPDEVGPWSGKKASTGVGMVNYKALMQDLFGSQAQQ